MSIAVTRRWTDVASSEGASDVAGDTSHLSSDCLGSVECILNARRVHSAGHECWRRVAPWTEAISRVGLNVDSRRVRAGVQHDTHRDAERE